MKDKEVDMLIEGLRDIALYYYDSKSVREMIRSELRPFIERLGALEKENQKLKEYIQIELERFDDDGK